KAEQLDAIANRFSDASDDVRAQALHATATLQREQERLRTDAEKLPIATRQSAEAMRQALNEQLRALEQLSALANRERRAIAAPRPPALGTQVSLTAAYAAQQASATIDAGLDGADRWSLGDLLARASRDEDGRERAPIIDLGNIARALDPATASA